MVCAGVPGTQNRRGLNRRDLTGAEAERLKAGARDPACRRVIGMQHTFELYCATTMQHRSLNLFDIVCVCMCVKVSSRPELYSESEMV